LILNGLADLKVVIAGDSVVVIIGFCPALFSHSN